MHHDDDADDQTSDPWLGRLLAQRYRVVARIGAGGMGVVYRAWDEAIQAYVVVKMPKRELIGDPKFLQRFSHELSALRALSHPAVVPISDIGNEQGTPFAVMPYLAGGSLKQRRPMFQDGRVAPEEPAALWRWLPAIAAALDFVHASNYVHRDVKPDNVLFDGPGAPYLSDFGVAKLVFQEEDAAATRGLTGTGFALGTPDYMAPELIGGTKANPRIDQYALAIMTYEMLAGRKPFDGPTAAAVMIAHATSTAPPLASLRPGIPPTISDAVARGMTRNPEERFDSCAAFAEAVLARTARPAAAEKLQLMCPECGRLLNVKPDWAGKQGNCPRCKTALTIGHDLRSLWIPADKAASQTPPKRIDVGQFSGTPSGPMPMPRPLAAPEAGSLSLAAAVNGTLEAIKQRLATSLLLQGLLALAVALLAVVTLVSFGGNDRKGSPAKAPEVARSEGTPPVAPPPRIVRPPAPPPAVSQQPEPVPNADQPRPEDTKTARVVAPPEDQPRAPAEEPGSEVPPPPVVDAEPLPEEPAQESDPQPVSRTAQTLDEFAGRSDPTLRQQLIQQYGGTEASEAAVDAGLEWIAAHQLADGSWSFDHGLSSTCNRACSHSGRYADRAAATALALLPMLGRGSTHTEGPYRKQVEMGIRFLADRAVSQNGAIYDKTGGSHGLYVQGLGAIVLAEAYAMTKDKGLAKPAQAALDFIMAAQDPVGGGWRYVPKQPGDTSALGWQLTALRSGHLAYLQVNPLTIKKAVEFLDGVQSEDGAAYGYTTPGSGLGTSAIGLLCRMHLGWKRGHPGLERGVARLAKSGPNKDIYYDYYATQIMHHMGGDAWRDWNVKMRDMLVNRQSKQGHEAGSWFEGFDSGHGPDFGGRLYCTSLATTILEVYYRFLPPVDIDATR